ncbi:MAG: nucleotidyltransferase domain-containing protein [Sulfuricaulis sp.]
MKTLAQLTLKANDRKAIEAAKDLLVQKYPVELIVLYGSKARGTDDAESDIDLLVLTTRELTWRERNTITDILYDIQLAHGVVISTFECSSVMSCCQNHTMQIELSRDDNLFHTH